MHFGWTKLSQKKTLKLVMNYMSPLQALRHISYSVHFIFVQKCVIEYTALYIQCTSAMLQSLLTTFLMSAFASSLRRMAYFL